MDANAARIPRCARDDTASSAHNGVIPSAARDLSIVPATIDHAHAITLRDGDAAEIAALGYGKVEALRLSLARSLWAETYLIDGTPAAIVGLCRANLLGGPGVPWLLTGPACERHRKTFLRESRRQVARMLEEAAPLVNFVPADYRRALRWMAWLGFTIEAPFRLNGTLFHRCTKACPEQSRRET